jgi:hypothetical protein
MPIRTKKVQGLRKKSKKPYSGVPIRSGLFYIMKNYSPDNPMDNSPDYPADTVIR